MFQAQMLTTGHENNNMSEWGGFMLSFFWCSLTGDECRGTVTERTGTETKMKLLDSHRVPEEGQVCSLGLLLHRVWLFVSVCVMVAHGDPGDVQMPCLPETCCSLLSRVISWRMNPISFSLSLSRLSSDYSLHPQSVFAQWFSAASQSSDNKNVYIKCMYSVLKENLQSSVKSFTVSKRFSFRIEVKDSYSVILPPPYLTVEIWCLRR